MTAGRTPATEALDRAGAWYRVHRYRVDEAVGGGYGEAVAGAIGMDPRRVFKTLVAMVDGEPVIAVVPVAGRLSTKALARAMGGKRCTLASPSEAERLTGYVTGGISPFGQKRRLPLCLDESARVQETIAVSGGRRGIQLELGPDDLLRLTSGVVAPISDL